MIIINTSIIEVTIVVIVNSFIIKETFNSFITIDIQSYYSYLNQTKASFSSTANFNLSFVNLTFDFIENY